MQDELIITLIEKFNAGSIAELDFRDGTAHLILRKEPAQGRASLPPVPQDKDKTESRPSAAAQAEARSPKGEFITSPIVATFYASPGPDAPPFVSAGSQVKAGDTLCILEAMKMMNHLEAEFDCEILSFQAKSGDLVEYGQTLFEVKRL